jgi:uncharacterized protein HemX
MLLRLVVLSAIGLLAACVTPEQQRAADQQQCAGFGFTPGSAPFANCMMRIAQQRQAETAAQQRQQQQLDAIAAEQDKQRQAEQDAANKAASEKSYQDWLTLSGHGADPVPAAIPDADPWQPPTASRIPGMVCDGEGEDAACDAR